MNFTLIKNASQSIKYILIQHKYCFNKKDFLENDRFPPNYKKSNNYLKKNIDKSFYLTLLQHIDQWQIIQFQEKENDESLGQIFCSISHINFSCLKILNIQSHQIQSIEAITWLNCIHLKVLSLAFNEISSIKSLSKTNFKKFTQFNLNLNPISVNQLAYFSRFKCPQLKQLEINFLSLYLLQYKKNLLITCIDELIKLQSKKIINSIYCHISILDKSSEKFKKKFINMGKNKRNQQIVMNFDYDQ